MSRVRPWLSASVVVGIIVSLVEAYLLDRKKGFFTGGFLADQILDTWGERAAFVVGSLAADIGWIACATAVAFWCLKPLRLGLAPAWTLAACAAGAVPAIADVVRFELDQYLGVDVDLGLLFDLAGRNVAEFAAVAWSHVATPVLLSALALVVLLVTGALVARRRAARGLARLPGVGIWRPALMLCGTVLLVSGLRVASPDADDALRRKPSVDWPGGVIDAITDVDRDGYGLLGRPADFAPLDPRVFPYAIDIPGNGVDEDGVLGDMSPALSPYTEGTPRPRWTSRRHVILIVLESVRADAVSARVNGRSATPVLDGLARRGLSSAQAWSHNGYTVQSRHHLLTGTLANLGDGTSLIDDFRDNGYYVGYISGQDDAFGSAALDVGYDRADYTYTARMEPERRYSRFATAGSLAVPFNVVEEKVDIFLAGRDRAEPVFLYLNFHDTHFPYHHAGLAPIVSSEVVPQRQIGPSRAAGLRSMYLNAVANVDAAIGRVLAKVEAVLGPEVGVIVVSDHGESLYEGGFLGHGYALDEVQTRIPLIVANLPMAISEPWGQIDLRPALHDALRTDPGGAVKPRRRTPRRGVPTTVGGVPATSDGAPATVDGEGVFQYLGSFARPRQIGWRTADGVMLYDVRLRRALLQSGQWTRESNVQGTDTARLAHVVTLWERMRLAVYHGERRQGAP